MSGIIEINKLAVWRYLAEDEYSIEGIPPNWLIAGIYQDKKKDVDFFSDWDIKTEDIHFIVNTEHPEYGRRIYLMEYQDELEKENLENDNGPSPESTTPKEV